MELDELFLGTLHGKRKRLEFKIDFLLLYDNFVSRCYDDQIVNTNLKVLLIADRGIIF